MKSFSLIFSLSMLTLIASGCYYDKESDLYDVPICDTALVTYSGTIRPIVNTSCSYSGCHDGIPANGGGFDFTNHAGLLAKVKDNSLLPSIEHVTGYSAMPQNGGKLPECTISKFRIWIAAGAPNN